MINADESLINLDFLKNFTGNDSARMRKYINMFLGSAPAEAENIRKALAEQNWEALRASAHSLRPQMTYMGMKSGENLLRQIEDQVQGKIYPGEISAMVEQFNSLFIAASKELKEKLTQIE
ncbi:MAG TPA: Hpt domain-containing protein [Bacteroidia bacterium]|nr:Hpt domain-containing protein [Bacteroidia bacterium]